MILCDHEIVAALRSGQIKIDPFPPDGQFETSSVDLTLSDEFKRWKEPVVGYSAVIDPSSEGYKYSALSKALLEECKAESDGSVIIRPHEFILGITRERIELPIGSRIAARVEGRSSLARLGLGVHMTAPTIQVGFSGQITLEMTNQGKLPIKLKPGLRICQLILEQVFGTPSMQLQGEFQNQTSVSGKL